MILTNTAIPVVTVATDWPTFWVTLVAAVGTVAVASIAAWIAWRSNKTADAANAAAKLANTDAKAAREREEGRALIVAEDDARRERYEFAEQIGKYLTDAGIDWSGTKVIPSIGMQWVALAKKSGGLRTANQSGQWVARSASRLVERIFRDEKRTLLGDPAQIQRVSKWISQQTLRTSEWVTDPQVWLDTYWAPEAAEMQAQARREAIIRAVGEPPPSREQPSSNA